MLVSLRACAVNKVGGGVICPAWRLGCAPACVALTLWTQTNAGEGEGDFVGLVLGPVAGTVNQVREARVVEFETFVCVMTVAAINLTEFLCAGLVLAGDVVRAAVPSGAAGIQTGVHRCGWVGWRLILLLSVICIVDTTLLCRCRCCREWSSRWLLRRL